jgi:UDP-N-acetylmuramoylalanine--D-glutamate ligase
MKLILGNGKTAQSVVRFLNKRDIEFVQIKDTRQIKNADILRKIDEIFISPGIAQTQNIVILARRKNIPITSDIELFSRVAQAPIIAITGSNGKSTVTQLLGEMLIYAGKNTAIGGNIGVPALDCLDEKIEFYVLELSSYQLDYSRQLNLFTGVVLNISPDHLDRYASFEHYVQSKLSLLDYCEFPVFNLDDSRTLKKRRENDAGFSLKLPANSTDFGRVVCHHNSYLLKGDKVIFNADELNLLGEHNIANVLAALTLGNQIGLDTQVMTRAIKQFKGLEHRLEWVAKIGNIDYYNDSKATNATATITAIYALMGRYKNIALIIGGIAKDENYADLFELIDENIRNVVLIGQSVEAFEKGLIKAQTVRANSMQTAVNFASQMADIDAVLLSPACASFDMFDNFEHRGAVFKTWVKSI